MPANEVVDSHNHHRYFYSTVKNKLIPLVLTTFCNWNAQNTPADPNLDVYAILDLGKGTIFAHETEGLLSFLSCLTFRHSLLIPNGFFALAATSLVPFLQMAFTLSRGSRISA